MKPAHLRRKPAQWGTQTLEGFPPLGQAADSASALAQAELTSSSLYRIPTPSPGCNGAEIQF